MTWKVTRECVAPRAAFTVLDAAPLRRGALGEHEASLRAFEEAHECFVEVGFRAHVAHALQGFAAYAVSEGRFEDAARLLGQARGELDEIGAPEDDFGGDMVVLTNDRTREALGEGAFEAAYAAGRAGEG